MMAGRSGDLDGPGADHPDVDELIDYVLGDLSQRRAGGVRAHAAGCLDCGDQLAALILLREERLSAEDGDAPAATVTLFPVPARAPLRRWPLAAAAAASLILGLAWFGWPAQVAEDERPMAAGAAPFAVEFEASDDDIRRVVDAVGDLLGQPFDAVRATGDRAPAESGAIAEAVQAVSSRDLIAARTLLEPFGQRWDRYGTALLGYVLFLLEDPAAYQVLEMYVAEHENQAWEPKALFPEDLAFFFAARLRHAHGLDAGAREAVAWIDPRAGAGPAAVAWLQATLGETGRDPARDIQQ